MSWNLNLFATCALALVFCLPGRGQDSPSLGDLARQAQKDKGNAPATKVFTNDDLPSSSGPSGPGAGLGRIVQPATPGKPATAASPSDELGRMESVLNELDAMDRPTLAKTVLQGVDTDFPGRSKWEEKLFTTKQIFVTQGRNLLKRAQQLEASAKNVQDIQNPNDPRAKDLSNRLQQLVQDGAGLTGAFQAVVTEGRNLASQSSPQ